jgi:hypothetical protein
VAEIDKQSGHPSSSRNDEVIAEVHDWVRADQRLTVKAVSKEQGISSVLVYAREFQDLGMRHVSAKFVPQLLTAEQKEHHLTVAYD